MFGTLNFRGSICRGMTGSICAEYPHDTLCTDPVYDPNNPNNILFPDYCSQYPYDCMNCRTDMDDEIAEGTLDNSPYTDETQWMMEQSLYNRLDNNPALRSDTLLDNFYTSRQNSVFSEMKNIFDNTAIIFQFDSAAIQNIDTNNFQIGAWLDTIQNKMELLKVAIDSGFSTAGLLTDINTYQNIIFSLHESSANILTEIDSQQYVGADIISADLNSMQATSTIAINEQLVNSIHIETFAKGIFTFTQAQIGSLSEIANQCPLIGGNIVFKARAMLNAAGYKNKYNDRDICNREGLALRHSNTKEIILKTRLYPNPANENITFTYETDIECKNKLTLYNALGQQVASYNLQGNTGKFIFSTSNLLPGIYAYRFICNNSAAENGKIVIIH